jgi:ABC-type dipeptide/oligopeptide/nickel transport system permease subunit
MAQRNYPLYIGLLLTFGFILIAIFGPSLAPHDPLERFNNAIFIDDEIYIPSVQPLLPFTLEMFPLGTDNAGRDLLSRLLWAIRPTLLLALVIVLVRVVVGLILGLAAGWYRGVVERLVDVLISISLSAPILLFALAIILFMGERTLPTFMIALTTTGWASTAVFVKNRTLVTIQAPYIEGARAVGVRPRRILSRYILPQLWPALPALIAFEVGTAILVVAELGFLGMFIGDAFVLMAADPGSAGTIPVGLTADLAELGQMLSDFWSKMIRSPWEVVVVGLTIFLLIFAFNMLGEGLRRQMDVTRPRRVWWRNRLQSAQPAPERSAAPRMTVDR